MAFAFVSMLRMLCFEEHLCSVVLSLDSMICVVFMPAFLLGLEPLICMMVCHVLVPFILSVVMAIFLIMILVIVLVDLRLATSLNKSLLSMMCRFSLMMICIFMPTFLPRLNRLISMMFRFILVGRIHVLVPILLFMLISMLIFRLICMLIFSVVFMLVFMLFMLLLIVSTGTQIARREHLAFGSNL